LSAKNVLNVPQHASGPFPPAALALSFSLDLVTTLVLLECLNSLNVLKAVVVLAISISPPAGLNKPFQGRLGVLVCTGTLL